MGLEFEGASSRTWVGWALGIRVRVRVRVGVGVGVGVRRSICAHLARSIPQGKASTVTAVWCVASRMYLGRDRGRDRVTDRVRDRV